MNLDDYLAAAGGFLRSRPVSNTIQLAALKTLRARGVAAFGGEPPMFGEVDGTAVAMAGALRPAAGVIRVAPVYTPPARRRRGYGGAVTAAVSRAALNAGASDVILFTDLANPTSNALCQRLGYRQLEDRVVLTFDS
ncbi:MAG TPA: GNAT family N-acetyltransferase [Streptosporangiaceae bacterium]|nr:GNAT family N-acetyltransferase [Streptosporangiaceae bacterium]